METSRERSRTPPASVVVWRWGWKQTEDTRTWYILVLGVVSSHYCVDTIQSQPTASDEQYLGDYQFVNCFSRLIEFFS